MTVFLVNVGSRVVIKLSAAEITFFFFFFFLLVER